MELHWNLFSLHRDIPAIHRFPKVHMVPTSCWKKSMNISKLFLMDYHCKTQSEIKISLEKDQIYWIPCTVRSIRNCWILVFIINCLLNPTIPQYYQYSSVWSWTVPKYRAVRLSDIWKKEPQPEVTSANQAPGSPDQWYLSQAHI